MLRESPQNIFFQQDGAPLHYSRARKHLFDAEVPNSWICSGGPENWPGRSPNPTPVTSFWGHAKHKVPPTAILH